MRPPTGRLRRAIAVLLVAAAGLFVVGVTSESDADTHNETAAEATEHDEQTEAAERQAAVSRAGEADEDEERVLGIDVESPALITAAVVASLLLAWLVWRHPHRQLLLVVAGFAALFAALDLAEVIHQLGEDRTGLAVLAAFITALHAAAAVIALHQSVAAPEQEPAPA